MHTPKDIMDHVSGYLTPATMTVVKKGINYPFVITPFDNYLMKSNGNNECTLLNYTLDANGPHIATFVFRELADQTTMNAFQSADVFGVTVSYLNCKWCVKNSQAHGIDPVTFTEIWTFDCEEVTP